MAKFERVEIVRMALVQENEKQENILLSVTISLMTLTNFFYFR